MSTREQLIEGLRNFADFLEFNPDAPAPYGLHANVFVRDKEEMRRFAKMVGGRLDKDASEEFFYLSKKFGPVRYEINISREAICEKVVVGTKVIPAEPERIIPATEERVEEITEWRCAEILK